MKIFSLFTTKGGQGCSTAAAGLAQQASEAGNNTLLVDISPGGDMAALLGILDDTTEVKDNLTLQTIDPQNLPTGNMFGRSRELFETPQNLLSDAINRKPIPDFDFDNYDIVVIDWGTTSPIHLTIPHTKLLVTKACYLSLRSFTKKADSADGIILLSDPSRALQDVDVESATGAKIVAKVPHDERIARTIDAGLLTVRLPRPMAGMFSSVLQEVSL